MAGPLQFSGMGFDVNVGLDRINVKKASLNITDNSTVGTEGGMPAGHLQGSVEADGELEVTTGNLKVIVANARGAGSWSDMKPIDLSFYAGRADGETKIEAFGCKLSLSKVIDIDGDGSDAVTHTIPFKVTSDDFVKIDGVRYLKPRTS